MKWVNTYKNISSGLSYMLGGTMLYVFTMTPYFTDNFFEDILHISIAGTTALILGTFITLLAHHYDKQEENFYISKLFLRYSLAIAVIPHLFYSFHYGLESINNLSTVIPADHYENAKLIGEIIAFTAISSASFLMTDRFYKVGVVGLIMSLTPLLVMDYILASEYVLRDLSLFNATMGLAGAAAVDLFIDKEDGKVLDFNPKALLTDHFVQSLSFLKIIFFCGVIVYSYENHIVKTVPADVELTANTIEGSWKMRDLNYYMISLEDGTMEPFLDRLSHIDSITLGNDHKGVITIDNTTSPVKYNINPSNNSIEIFGLEEIADFELSGTYAFMEDGQMKLKYDKDNIFLTFDKNK